MDYGVYSRHSACLRTISARCQIQSTPRYLYFCAAKLQNNADAAKHFWKINAVRPINKGNSRKIGESPQGATKQIKADCGTN